MKLKPFDSRWTALAAGWLNEKNNWQWLQPGNGAQKLDPLTFRAMAQSPEHEFHLFYDDANSQPIGMVAFSDMDQTTKTARIWFVLGDKLYAGRGYTKRAVYECLRYAFFDLGLNTVYAHTVSENEASIAILEQCKFNFIGRRRQCYLIDNELKDLMLYDLLAVEFLEGDIKKYNNVLRLDKRVRTKRPVAKTIEKAPTNMF